MKKFVKTLLTLALTGCLALSFAACANGDNKPNDDDQNGGGTGTTYTFEAEYTDLTGLKGMGPSGSPTGLGLIGESTEASNGFYVGSLGIESPITFKITSDKAATANLKAIFGSNALAPITWTSAEFAIEVNGTAMTYTSFKTETSVSSTQNFKLRTLGDIQLKAGENTIVFKPKDNKYLNGTTSAPSIDCIKLVTEASLTFDAKESNLD